MYPATLPRPAILLRTFHHRILMTQTLAVNENNDLYLSIDGNIAMVYDLTAVLQICAHVVKVRLGEVVLNTDQGLPFFETVWNGSPNLIQFEAAARATLLGVTGVVEVVSFDMSIVDSSLVYVAVIRTIYGTGTINGGL
jgi:hypothetical protein